MKGARWFLLILAFLPTEAYSKTLWGGTLSLGFPHPLNLSVERRAAMDTSQSFGFGSFKPTLDQIELDLSNMEIRARWHPWDGAIIVGAALGMQNISARASKTFDDGAGTQVPVNFAWDVTSLYFTPHAGWLWMWESGFTLGFELGYQLPIGAGSKFDINPGNPSHQAAFDAVKSTQIYKDFVEKIDETGRKLGGAPFPFITALRIGWMF